MTPCDRPFRHHPHPYVDGHGADRQCDGGRADLALAWLLAQRPELEGVGVAAQVTAIGVAAA